MPSLRCAKAASPSTNIQALPDPGQCSAGLTGTSVIVIKQNHHVPELAAMAAQSNAIQHAERLLSVSGRSRALASGLVLAHSLWQTYSYSDIARASM